MKAIYKALLAAVVATPLLTGCIEEAFPTSGIVQSQLEGSPRATEALVWAMPGHLNQILAFGSTQNGWDMGYPGIMHFRDLLTADLRHSTLGANYNHFWYWQEISLGLGPDYLYPQYPWNWCYEQINICNKVINAIDAETENSELRMQLATAYAYRAFTYLDFGRMYELLPVELDNYCEPRLIGLTMVIVDQNMTEDEIRANPRVSHEALVEFINSDLDKAVALFNGASSVPSKTLPSLAVVYGLKARTALWDASFQEEINSDVTAANAQYTEAKRYADLALSTHGEVYTTREEWLSTTTGFNDSSVGSWMFCGQYVTEDDAVQSRNFSWVGWMSSEKSYGYSSTRLQCFPEIGASLYNSIDNRDFRKLTFVAPTGSPIADEVPYLDEELAAEYFTVPYIGIKFRPGSGSITDGNVGCATAYPLMRTEEMKFISIECAAHLDPAQGKSDLESFMKSYRFSGYRTNASSKEDIIDEIICQKRIELWGEGQVFFDLKRLNYSIIREYNGTNFEYGSETYNTTGRPAWMNLCITNQECNNNSEFPRTDNTPTPAGLYQPIDKSK